MYTLGALSNSSGWGRHACPGPLPPISSPWQKARALLSAHTDTHTQSDTSMLCPGALGRGLCPASLLSPGSRQEGNAPGTFRDASHTPPKHTHTHACQCPGRDLMKLCQVPTPTQHSSSSPLHSHPLLKAPLSSDNIFDISCTFPNRATGGCDLLRPSSPSSRLSLFPSSLPLY